MTAPFNSLAPVAPTPSADGRVIIDLDNRIGGRAQHEGWMAGSLWAAPNVRKVLPFTLQGGSPANCQAAKVVLVTMIRSELAAGRRVAPFGHSYGAQIINATLRDEALIADLPTDPAYLEWYTAADPEHRFNGHDKASTGYALYGGNGIPLNTPHTVYSMTRQYDFFSDYPTQVRIVGSGGAVNDAPWSNINDAPSGLYNSVLTPRGLPIGPGMAVHIDYTRTPFFDPRPDLADTAVGKTHVSWTDPGNPRLRYVYALTSPAAWLQSARSNTFAARLLDKLSRASIEAGYSGRPRTLPTPTVF